MKKNYILLLALFVASISFAQNKDAQGGPNPGDIIITEIMQNPTAVGDSSGEWFEVYNTTVNPIDLDGWTITDDGGQLHLITGSVVVNGNAYAVLGVNGDTTTNGNITVDYVYGSDIGLSNGSDELVLTAFGGGAEIDRVNWDNGATFPDPGTSDAASMNLNPDFLNGTDNDNGVNWCLSTAPIGNGDKGTPGAANSICGTPCTLVLGNRTNTCDAFTAGQDTYTVTIEFTGGGASNYVINVNDGVVGGDNPSTSATGIITITNLSEGTDLTFTLDDLAVGGSCSFDITFPSPVCIPSTCAAVGSVIINEIMQNPLAPINDSEAEWFELYNTTGADIDLIGWSIVDDNNPTEGFVIPNTLIIPSGGYLLFANNGNPATNGGLPTPDYVYANGFPFLGNGTDGLIVQCGGAIIDIVIWDNGVTFPDPNGASMSLNIGSQDSVANDDGANWQEVTFTYGPTGQFGTPGGANDTQLGTGTNEIEGFSIYPNPVVDGSLVINTLSTTTKNVSVYSLLGKLVYSNSINGTNNELNLGKLTTGIYILKVEEGTSISTVKLAIK